MIESDTKAEAEVDSSSTDGVSIVLSDVASELIASIAGVLSRETPVDYFTVLRALLNAETRHYLELLAQEGSIYMRADTPDARTHNEGTQC